MKKKLLPALLIGVILINILPSCNKFLDVKPDGKMVVPATLKDCELLLNDYNSMNCSYPSSADVSADDYYLPHSMWMSIPVIDDKNYYIWSDETPVLSLQWTNAYKIVYTANQVIQVLSTLKENDAEKLKYNQLKGAAHFYRAFTFHRLMTSFTLPYNEGTAKQQSGIPLKLTPDLEQNSRRLSVYDCYQQIIDDYQLAVSMLGVAPAGKGKPGKAAAFAGLARIYLDMQDYEQSYRFADSSLRLTSELLDYNSLNRNSYAPIPAFNKEILFPATTVFSYALLQGYARIDTVLYKSYSATDLRKTVYFAKNYDLDYISYEFKGSYDNTQSGNFIGLTSSEMYLVKAESAARLNKVDVALSAINTLLENRYANDSFQPVNMADADALLAIILAERRKELVFRGLRWADLKRLNQDVKTQITLKRQLGGNVYTLAPNSLSYALMIPLDVINEGKIEQNKR